MHSVALQSSYDHGGITLTTGLEKEAILFFMPLSLSPYTLLLQNHFFSTDFGF